MDNIICNDYKWIIMKYIYIYKKSKDFYVQNVKLCFIIYDFQFIFLYSNLRN